VQLGVGAAKSFDPAVLDDAERVERAGDPAAALALVDGVRGAAPTRQAARADAVGAEVAFALGRDELARTLAARGLGEDADAVLRARLLRVVIAAQAEGLASTSNTRDFRERQELAETSARRASPEERLLDGALDLRVALVFDAVWAPPLAPAAAHAFVELAAASSDEALAPVAGMACRAARLDGRTSPAALALLERGSRLAQAQHAVRDEAVCELTSSDQARDAGRLDDAEAHARAALERLGEQPVPREQREAKHTAALVAAGRGDLATAFERARGAYRWVDVLLALQASVSERDALLALAVGYYGGAARFAIRGGDAAAGITAVEWGKGRAFAELLQAAAGPRGSGGGRSRSSPRREGRGRGAAGGLARRAPPVACARGCGRLVRHPRT
jgi:hypothetical protein